MSSQKKPLYRVVSGTGTSADPHVVTSDLLNTISRIPVGGYHYIPARIAEARKLMALTELSDETRAELEGQLLSKEYWWHSARAGYLVQLAMDQRLPTRRDDLLMQARQAREDFDAFDASHPTLEISTRRTPPTVDELLAQHEERRRARLQK